MKQLPSLEQIQTTLRLLMPQLRKEYEVDTLEIFGSYVRAEATPQSDLDLLVTFSRPPSLFTYIALEQYLSDVLGIPVDLVMKDALKPHIGKHILQEAQSI